MVLGTQIKFLNRLQAQPCPSMSLFRESSLRWQVLIVKPKTLHTIETL